MEFLLFLVFFMMLAIPAAAAAQNGNGVPVTVFAGQPVPTTSLGSPRPKKVRFFTRNGRLMTARVVSDFEGRATLRRPGHPNGACFSRYAADLRRAAR